MKLLKIEQITDKSSVIAHTYPYMLSHSRHHIFYGSENLIDGMGNILLKSHKLNFVDALFALTLESQCNKVIMWTPETLIQGNIKLALHEGRLYEVDLAGNPYTEPFDGLSDINLLTKMWYVVILMVDTGNTNKSFGS